MQRTLSSLAWGGGGAEGGAESAFLATTSPDSDAVEVLDARVGRAARVVSSGGAGLGSGGGAGFTGFTGGFTGENEGLLDVCFAPNAGGVSFAASGRKGRVFLWDARCAAAPRATLHAPGASAASSKAAVRCVRFGCDGQTVLAGTGAGEIHVWDLRGGSGSGFSKTSKGAGSAFSVASRRTTSFPVLFTTRVADALALAPTLSGGHLDAPARRLWQDAMRSGVDWCEQDPHDPRRVGFHLNSGWSGVLDLASGDKDGGGGSRRRRTRTARRRCTRRARTALRRYSRPGSRSLRWRTGARRLGSRTARGLEVRGAPGRVSGNLRRARAGLLADAGGAALGRRRHRGGPRRRGAVRGARVSQARRREG